jgi:putative heme-binding domain-containing protein
VRITLAIALASLWLAAPASRADDLGLRVAPGFRVTLFADHEIANDLWAMTLDAQGRVVVTSRGWVKRLEDTDGKADRAVLLAHTTSGGMGLCFDGDDLWFCGDGWLSRYRHRPGQDPPYGPPEHILPLAFGEHGGHAMRKGPDGYWYVIAGNDAGISAKHATNPRSPVKHPEAGGILRVSPDGKSSEVIAHGFRNPYDFDFNAAGDLFTYDSDMEADSLLPWYSPTRLYHVAPGGHHGWRLTGYKRSWCRRDFYPDTVDVLWPIGRGSPTGVVCYRHDQFPERYRGGLFALDWTFGKVYFCPLTPNGATYRTQPEVFLESVGTSGFDPTDVVVAPDGSLLICMGGRGTRGAVFRVEYVGGEGLPPVRRLPKPANDLEAVLRAPQPLDAWSRAKWEPLARKIGRQPFAAVVADEDYDTAGRVRAVEVLTELFGGAMPEWAVEAAVKSREPRVRARVAWCMGRRQERADDDRLANLTTDSDAGVRQAALTALADKYPDEATDLFWSWLPPRLGDRDKRIRLAAMRFATELGATQLASITNATEKAGPQAVVSKATVEAGFQKDAATTAVAIDTALDVLDDTNDTDLQLQALRVIVRALGDWRLKDPPAEAFTGYSLQGDLTGRGPLVKRILSEVRPLFPSADERLNEESTRLLAMLEDDDSNTLTLVAAQLTPDSSPTIDMHYLACLARLRGRWDADLAKRVAKAVLALDRKLLGRQQRTKQNWSLRLAEVVQAMLKHEPRLADEFLRSPEFPRPAHVELALGLDGERRVRAARQFLAAARADQEFAWTGPLIELLSVLPANEVRPVLRAQWANLGLRDAILPHLTDPPDPEDRDRFLAGLDSPQRPVARLCLDALARLPRDESAAHLAPLVALLRQLTQEPKEADLRRRALALLERQTGQSFAVKEPATTTAALREAYQPVFAWFERTHPDLTAATAGANAAELARWTTLLPEVAWDKGDTRRGEALFRNRACATCHGGPSRLGPDLAGATSRFARPDLLAAIIDPSRDVAPAYRVTDVETRKGMVLSGMVIYESAEGVILQTGAATTVRLTTEEIAERRPSPRSLMPDGLLKDLGPQDLADLVRYLQTLTPGPGGKPAG